MQTTKIFFSSLFLITIFLSGCSDLKEKNIINPPTEVNKNQETKKINNKKEDTITPSNQENSTLNIPTEKKLNYKNEKGLEVKNNEIFFYDNKRGWISGDRIFLTFEDNVYSFEYHNGIDKLNFHPIENFESVVYYDNLTINLPKDDDIKIVYQCNGPLLQDRPYEYCKTNGKDNLQQYEFGGAYRQFSTGGGFTLSWNNIFIKKINDKNIIFESKINNTFIDTDPSFLPLEALETYKSLLKYELVENLNLNTELQNTDSSKDFEEIQKKLKPIHTEMREIIKSKKYLDKIKNEPINLKNEKIYQKIINSFLIEEKA